jgi:chromosome partitioning protein
MNIISIVNNKGGVGKTTILQNLGICLARKGYLTGVVDFDAQANLSLAIKHELQDDLVSLLNKKKPINLENFSKTNYDNLLILPNKKDVSSELFNNPDPIKKLFVLKDALSGVKNFDFLFIDTAPTLDIPTYNAMVASNYILIPMEYDFFSAVGLSVLYDYIISARTLNKDLKILGVLINKVHEGQKINKEVQAPLVSNFGDVVLKTVIRTNVKFKQSQMEQNDIFSFEAKKSDKRGSEDIEKLCKEILKIINLKS